MFLPRLTENPLLLKIFDLKERRFLGDFCFSFLQVGYRPPKKKGQKAPKYTALRQVRTIRVTLSGGRKDPPLQDVNYCCMDRPPGRSTEPPSDEGGVTQRVTKGEINIPFGNTLKTLPYKM